MARAELIEAQRQALLLEMQHIRKDILQQEAWLRVRPLPSPLFRPLLPMTPTLAAFWLGGIQLYGVYNCSLCTCSFFNCLAFVDAGVCGCHTSG